MAQLKRKRKEKTCW